MNGVFPVRSRGKWLKGGELWVCAAQPPPIPHERMANDESRPDSLSVARWLFEKADGAAPVTRWCGKRPALVVFPELAFGSGDFAELDARIAGLPGPTIVLAGFGFAGGGTIRQLIEEHEHLHAGWSDGVDALDPDGRYNAGWCWIRRPGRETTCHVFLKNFPESTYEVAWVPNWTESDEILRVDTGDLVLFPVICADVIDDRPEGASVRSRIRASLGKGEARKALVVALLLDEKTESDYWQKAIEYVVGSGEGRTICFLVNHLNPPPRRRETADCFRSLTGAFIDRKVMGHAPKEPLPHVRHVKAGLQGRGLVVRVTRPGVTAGTLRWTSAADRGRYVWLPNRRFEWTEQGLRGLMLDPAGAELARFLERRREELLRPAAGGMRKEIDQRTSRLGQALEQLPGPVLKKNLWPRLLVGVEAENRGSETDEEALHDNAASLDRALRMLAALYDPGVVELADVELKEGQLVFDDDGHEAEILIWKDPTLNSREQLRVLERLVKKSGSTGRRLYVIGDGAAWGKLPERQLVRPTGLTNIGEHRGAVTGPRATSAGQRPVHWRPLGDLEEVLAGADVGHELTDRLLDEVRAP